MSHFAALLENSAGTAPAVSQANARRDFSTIVASSKFGQRSPDQQIPTRGTYVVIGVATYSPDDLAFLDDVAESVSSNGTTGVHIDVFDVADCKDMEDINRYVPVGDVYQTPIVGVWNDGQSVVQGTGLAASREAIKKSGLFPAPSPGIAS